MRRYQNPDGSMTEAGKERYYGNSENKNVTQIRDYVKQEMTNWKNNGLVDVKLKSKNGKTYFASIGKNNYNSDDELDSIIEGMTKIGNNIEKIEREMYKEDYIKEKKSNPGQSDENIWNWLTKQDSSIIYGPKSKKYKIMNMNWSNGNSEDDDPEALGPEHEIVGHFNEKGKFVIDYKWQGFL